MCSTRWHSSLLIIWSIWLIIFVFPENLLLCIMGVSPTHQQAGKSRQISIESVSHTACNSTCNVYFVLRSIPENPLNFFNHSLQASVLCIILYWKVCITICLVSMNGILKIIFQMFLSLLLKLTYIFSHAGEVLMGCTSHATCW